MLVDLTGFKGNPREFAVFIKDDRAFPGEAVAWEAQAGDDAPERAWFQFDRGHDESLIVGVGPAITSADFEREGLAGPRIHRLGAGRIADETLIEIKRSCRAGRSGRSRWCGW